MSNSETTIDMGRRKQVRSNATRAMGKSNAANAGPPKDAGAKASARVRRSSAATAAGNDAASGEGGAVLWQRMVAEAAYFRAERRGFVGGSPEQDWFEAEIELQRAFDDNSALGSAAYGKHQES